MTFLFMGCSTYNQEEKSAQKTITQARDDLYGSELQVIIDKMIENGEFTGSATGVAGTEPHQWRNYLALKESATRAEFYSLTNHSSPIIRSYAFQALCEMKDSTVLDILLAHQNDTAKIFTQSGCSMMEESVKDIFHSDYVLMIMQDTTYYDRKIVELEYAITKQKGDTRPVQSIWGEKEIQVHLCNIDILWDNSQSTFIENEVFVELRDSFYTDKKSVINEILNEEQTSAWACDEPDALTKGELAFLFIHQVEPLPLMKIFGIQWDVWELNCPYPYGLIHYIRNNRTTVVQKLHQFFET
jgi:hypothetical protein